MRSHDLNRLLDEPARGRAAPSENKFVVILGMRWLGGALRVFTQARWPVWSLRDARRAGFFSSAAG